MTQYVGRFAPSPTGDLHAGSLACALASFLDARAHQGLWLLRIEDIDPPREIAGAAARQIELLSLLGMRADRPIVYQSERSALYQSVLDELIGKGLVYGCACSRSEIAVRQRQLNLPKGVYPGTCRQGTASRRPRAWRLSTEGAGLVQFADRWMGSYQQALEYECGDFVLKRADGLWAYQLACTTDDALQGVTHIVRGADLLDNTPRQRYLQSLLGWRQPVMMHIPLVLGADGQKLSKQNLAHPVDATHPKDALMAAWQHLGFEAFEFGELDEFYRQATRLWQARFSLF